jgi:uncharacterized protein YxeA
MKVVAVLMIYGLIYISVMAYNKYKNDNFNPYK